MPLKQILYSKIIFFVLIGLCLWACEEEVTDQCENSQQGVLKDYTGLDGCGWLIQLSDSTRIEPINLDDFEIDLVHNKSVCVQFHERKDLGSYCMSGKVIEIEFIE